MNASSGNWLCVACIVTALACVTSTYAQTRKVVKLTPRHDLPAMVDAAPPGTTLLLADGLYRPTRPLVFRQPDVEIRSASGQRDKVIIDGQRGSGKVQRDNCVNELLAVQASDVTIADISIRHARDHGIHIAPHAPAHVRNVVMRNIHIYDCGQQLIKANSGSQGDALYWTDDCILEDSLIEFVDNSIMQDMGRYFYTGGLDVHGGKHWIIRRNVFRNIQRDAKMMEHAVHMWSACRGTLVESNRFIDCYRAIGFGMKTKPEGRTRVYPDGQSRPAYFDHIEGVIRNNFIFNRRGIHLEAGIELMNVWNVRVLHNTVISHDRPFSSIEYRWPNTRVQVINNLTSHRILPRDDARAELKNNPADASSDWFVDYGKGDLHLTAVATDVIDRGVRLTGDLANTDIDGQARDARPDIGADELNVR